MSDPSEDFLARRFRNLARMAPDLLDIALMTISNPISGLSEVIKRVAEKATAEANIQKEAEEEFQERLKKISDETPSLITKGNINETIARLIEEGNKLAENALKTNDQELMDQVFAFYRSSQKKLFSSTTKKPLTTEQLANIQTELGLIRLKVLWADSKKSAELAQKFREEEYIREKAHQINIKERALQLRAFLVFLLFIGSIASLIVFGSQIWKADETIPWLDIPISIVFWSAIGSATNMLYKYYKRNSSIDIDRELRRAWARPLVGVIMGVITYLVAVSGLILVGAATPQNVEIEIKPQILSLFAFLGGFSDKIFESVIDKVGLIATNDKNDDEKLQNIIELMTGKKVSDLETDEKKSS